MSKKSVLVLLLFATTGVAILIGWLLSNPLRRSSDDIRLSLLERTPLGSSEDDVRRFVESKGWRSSPGQKDNGFFMVYRREHGGTAERAICAYLGDYQGLPWGVTVSSMWVFDRDGRLTDIMISKGYDMP